MSELLAISQGAPAVHCILPGEPFLNTALIALPPLFLALKLLVAALFLINMYVLLCLAHSALSDGVSGFLPSWLHS